MFFEKTPSSCCYAYQFVTLVLTVLEMAFLQEFIKDQVANMYLWPKTLEVPIMDPAKYVLAFV